MAQTVEIGVNEGERARNRKNATGVINDLHERLDELRAQGEVHVGGMPDLFGVPDPMMALAESDDRFSIVGYDAADEAFRKHDVFSSHVYAQTAMTWGPNMLAMDEPEHRRYRGLVSPAFANRTMDDWEKRWLNPILDQLVGELAGSDRAELYMGYCARFPAHTIATSFGIADEDVSDMHDWLLRMMDREDPEAAARAGRQVSDYISRLIRERRAHPSDDLISLLATSELVEEDGSRHQLSDEEILGFAGLMLTAGSGTTYRSLGILLFALLNRPELLERVVADRTLVPQVVEESIRWDPPLSYFSRLVKSDTELAGVELPEGAVVDVCVTAANHDPTRWDDPHAFDPFREVQPHLSFASGPHFCIGNQLARMELQVALGRLLDEFPRMRLDPDAEAPYITGLCLRMPTSLPVLLRG